MRRGAFTLIEILVVVGIIALLAGIAFPVFSRVREGGRRATCTSNLKQLGLAFQLYLDDSAGRFPHAGNYQAWANGGSWVTGGKVGEGPHNFYDKIPKNPKPNDDKYLGGGLAGSSSTEAEPFKTVDGREAKVEYGALFPYVKNAATYVCPSAPSGKERKLSYSMNCALSMARKVRLRQPSQMVLLVDEGKTLNDGYFWATGQSGNNPTDSLFDGHNGGGNVLFADGSLKFFTFKQLPLDWNGSKTEVGSGIYLKSTMTGDVRFHDAALGKYGTSASITTIDDETGKLMNACVEDISTP